MGYKLYPLISSHIMPHTICIHFFILLHLPGFYLRINIYFAFFVVVKLNFG